MPQCINNSADTINFVRGLRQTLIMCGLKFGHSGSVGKHLQLGNTPRGHIMVKPMAQ